MGAIGRFGGRRPCSRDPFSLDEERPEGLVHGQLFVALTISRQKYEPARVMWAEWAGPVGRRGSPSRGSRICLDERSGLPVIVSVPSAQTKGYVECWS